MDFKLLAFAFFMIGLAFLVLKDQQKVERFQSAGTLLQLATSHVASRLPATGDAQISFSERDVPTRAELRQDRLRERRQIHHDLADLTGSY